MVCRYQDVSLQLGPSSSRLLPAAITAAAGCSHIVYAAASIDGFLRIKSADSNGAAYTSLKAAKARLSARTLISVGGPASSANDTTRANMLSLLSPAANRSIFIRSVVEHSRAAGFDGIEIDFRDLPANSSSNFVALIVELRSAIEAEKNVRNRTRLLLAVTAPADTSAAIRVGADGLSAIGAAVDWLTVLTHDMSVTGQGTALHAKLSPDGSVDASIETVVAAYVAQGIRLGWIVVSVPAFGVGYTLAGPSDWGVGSPVDGPSAPGPVSGRPGYLSFAEIQAIAKNQSYESVVYEDSPAGSAYRRFGKNQWVGYDTPRTAARKADYVRKTGLAGIMIQSLDQDDVTSFSLHQAVATALLAGPDQSSGGAAGTESNTSRMLRGAGIYGIALYAGVALFTVLLIFLVAVLVHRRARRNDDDSDDDSDDDTPRRRANVRQRGPVEQAI
eukprot:m.64347 g.64347  ORF g.64347 m.64347 type:complete len:446 (+) comp7252_c0_seq3:324-1661(+)